MSKIAREVAQEDVNSWLDKKKVFAATRERYEDHIETLIEAIMEGALILDAEAKDASGEKTFEFTHNLLWPIKGEQPIETLKYKSRLNDKQLQPYLKGVKSDDADGRLLAHVAALTGTARGILVNLDSADKRISLAIAVFFL